MHLNSVLPQQTPFSIIRPGEEIPWCDNEWQTGQRAEPLSGARPNAFETTTPDDSSDTCHSALALSLSRLLRILLKNSSDGPMTYLTHADVFCIKRALNASVHLHWWKSLLQQRLGCVIPSKHFLHHQFCFCWGQPGLPNQSERRKCFRKCWATKQIPCHDSWDTQHGKS